MIFLTRFLFHCLIVFKIRSQERYVAQKKCWRPFLLNRNFTFEGNYHPPPRWPLRRIKMYSLVELIDILGNITSRSNHSTEHLWLQITFLGEDAHKKNVLFSGRTSEVWSPPPLTLVVNPLIFSFNVFCLVVTPPSGPTLSYKQIIICWDHSSAFIPKPFFKDVIYTIAKKWISN